MTYVNLYKIESCFGGQEEGGWYYDRGEFLECLGTFPDTIAGQKAAENTCETFKNEETSYRMGHGSYDGVDSNGNPDDRFIISGGAWGRGKIRARIQKHEGQNYPVTTPYYC